MKHFIAFVLTISICNFSSAQYFQDVTAATGIGTLGFHSTSWGDINHDGYEDLLTSGKLFLNNKNGTFTDITSSAGIYTPYYVSTFIDMNNDGWDDILFLHTTGAYNIIYINNGNNTFTAIPLTMGTPDYIFISTLSVADVNNDKYPDLFVGQLRDVNNGNAPLKNYLYLNDKNNGFTYTDIYPPNMGSSSAIPDSTKWETRASMFTDYDNDGDMDLYVAIYRQEQDQLWQNDGTGHFTNMLRSCCTYIDYIPQPVDWSDHGTGCDWADYDNDGDMDLLLSNFAHPTNYYNYGFGTTTIWRNDGYTASTFTNMKNSDGIAYKESYAGAAWGDIDANGLPDIYITCFAYYASCDKSEMYLQQADHSFTNITSASGVNIAKGEADGSFVDYDNDGKLDLASGINSFNFLLMKNNWNTGNNWLQLDLTSVTGNAMAIGAKVVVVAGGQTYTQYQVSNHGALQCKGNRMYFGLGNATTISSVTVTWPNGTVNSESFSGINVNGIYHLVEGTGSSTAVQENNTQNIEANVFPNPATDDIQFTFSSSANQNALLEVFSVLGEKVYSENISAVKGYNHKTISVKGLKIASGLYTYHMMVGENSCAGKILIAEQ